ncbi:uncharacterized protein [Spinacia oleracea]|uniref:Uncharacterized protein isoform X2 n=1 Tax=Spinacia oleracea TaxID=3562 RepID=A0ABM3QJN5_SPIOL|nr:uncharacterized protein LOC130459947 isoform X2 [Spinacia oleracea]
MILVIACDGMDANQRDCYGVVGPKSRVSDGYVRMASVMYTKTWETEFSGRSKRIMLDPSYALRIMLKKNDHAENGWKYGKGLLNHPLSDIGKLFVPVLEAPQDNPGESHWWCIAFDFKAKAIWIIDSLYNDPYSQHADIISNLFHAVEVLVQLSDARWQVGQMSKWEKHTVEVLEPRDNSSCSVVMLWGIKTCASRFVSRFGVSRIINARTNLLLEDAQSDLNEIKSTFEQLLPKTKKRRRVT